MAKNNKTKGSKRPHKSLGIWSKVNAVAFKCYDEQLYYGWDATINAIRSSCNKEEMYVMAIRHDRDEVTDGIWALAQEKPHYHIIVKYVDRKKKERVKNIMDRLLIYYRPQIDDTLIANHGIESIGSFVGYANYLTHDTEDAIRDNKETYSIEEIVSNLNTEEIIKIRKGTIRIFDKVDKVSMLKLSQLDEEAYQLGYQLANLEHWYNDLPFSVRSNAKIKTIEESYYRGVQSRIQEGTALNRLCVYIQGIHDSGKTYAARQALSGKQTIMIGGGGSGKFDRLRPDHDAIIIDDDVCPNLLNMTDNYICEAYRRNSNNPVWAGHYFIVTSNLSFNSWLRACNVKKLAHRKALLSRFYICSIVESNGIRHLALMSPSTRGSAEIQMERAMLFNDFQAKYNASLLNYSSNSMELDYSNMIDPAYLQAYKNNELEREMEACLPPQYW